jgi:hypothetical protein
MRWSLRTRGLVTAVNLALVLSLLVGGGVSRAATELPTVDNEFGTYEPVPLLPDSPAYAGPSTPTSLDGVGMTGQVDGLLDADARATLAEQGFVVVPEEFRLFHHAYDEQYYTGTPVFVTTDAAFHAWHQIFDKTLRDLETRRLSPALEQLLVGMRRNAVGQAEALAGSPLQDDARKVVDLLSVALAELGGDVRLSSRARQEKALIDEHTQSMTPSPILGTDTDYSLYTPRGHYTRTKALTRYFVAMSVLGQTAFRLPGSVQTDGTRYDSVDGLRVAVLASNALVGVPELEALWRAIYEPTAFLVGSGDDYTPFELMATAGETGALACPEGDAGCATSTDLAPLSDDQTLYAVSDALKAARPVLIDPERPSVRLMGTRFVIDSWIFDQLMRPNVGTPEKPRILASPLDLAAAFGSDFALAIQDAAGETAYLHYPEQMEAMQAAVAARPDEAWGETVYDAWLAAVEPMWLPHGAAFPDFIQSDGWRAKAQQTGFGSYAELKHDTILYTKQAVGEMGAIEPELPPVRNWVEPDPVPFQRLAAIARLTRDGLQARELLPRDLRRLLTEYIRLVDRLAVLAADELAAQPISDDDNEWLRAIGGVLEGFWWRTGDRLDTPRPIRDDDAAVIADIMRGIDLEKNIDEVLEIGTGRIDRIFVLVPDDAGDFHVASGGVYSYYEFPWPTEDRLTDEQWWEMLRRGEAPDRPAWQEPLFP